jgi:3-hydroxyacyl-CoA dehydrogenase
MARTESPVRRAVVLGAGHIGAGWAALFAAYGTDVTLVDPDLEALARAEGELRVARALGAGRDQPGTLILARDLEPALAKADWVQESTPETLELKQSLLARVESLAPSEAILASSTSSLTRRQLAQGMRRPERLCIVHPLQPVYAVPVVEVNVDPTLAGETIERVLATLRGLGREPVLVRGERPGLVANRLTSALLREALDLIGGGVISAADLDRLVARGIALGWVTRGPLATEIIGGRLEDAERLPQALEATLAPLWSSLASWETLDGDARAAVERELRNSLGQISKTHAAGESAWAKTLSRVARAAEELDGPFPGDPGRRLP